MYSVLRYAAFRSTWMNFNASFTAREHRNGLTRSGNHSCPMSLWNALRSVPRCGRLRKKIVHLRLHSNHVDPVFAHFFWNCFGFWPFLSQLQLCSLFEQKLPVSYLWSKLIRRGQLFTRKERWVGVGGASEARFRTWILLHTLGLCVTDITTHTQTHTHTHTYTHTEREGSNSISKSYTRTWLIALCV